MWNLTPISFNLSLSIYRDRNAFINAKHGEILTLEVYNFANPNFTIRFLFFFFCKNPFPFFCKKFLRIGYKIKKAINNLIKLLDNCFVNGEIVTMELFKSEK